MTGREFNEWMAFHQGVFPEVRAWLDELKNQELVLTEWSRALGLVDLEDAMDCSRRMLAGAVEHPNRFEISRLPAAIVKHTPYRVAPVKP